MGKLHTEPITPVTHRFVCHGHATLKQQLLDVAQAQVEAVIPAHCIADDCRREAVAVERGSGRCHLHILSAAPINLTLPNELMTGDGKLESLEKLFAGRHFDREIIICVFAGTCATSLTSDNALLRSSAIWFASNSRSSLKSGRVPQLRAPATEAMAIQEFGGNHSRIRTSSCRIRSRPV